MRSTRRCYKTLKTLTLLLLMSVQDATSQAWQDMDSLWISPLAYGGIGTGQSRTLAFIPCSSLVVWYSYGYPLVSEDAGHHYRAITPSRTRYDYCGVYTAECNASITGTGFDNDKILEYHILSDAGDEWLRYDPFDSIIDYNYFNPFNGIWMNGALIHSSFHPDPDSAANGGGLCASVVASVDNGATWLSLIECQRQGWEPWDFGQSLSLIPVTPQKVSVRMEAGWIEINTESLDTVLTGVSKDVVDYVYCEDGTIIGSLDADNLPGLILHSSDNGQTWDTTRFLSFVNTDLTITADRHDLLVQDFINQADGRLCGILESGEWISSTDCGSTWIYHGDVVDNKLTRQGVTLYENSGYALYFPRYSKHSIGVLAAGEQRVATLRKPSSGYTPSYSPYYREVESTDESLLLAQSDGLYVYDFSDETWYAVPFPDSVIGNQSLAANVIHYVDLLNIFPIGGRQVQCYSPQRSNVFLWDDSREMKWSVVLDLGYIDEESYLLDKGLDYTFAGPDTLISRNELQFVVNDDTTSLNPGLTRNQEKLVSHISMTGTSDWWIFGDSTYHSTDNGQTWASGGDGLPREANKAIAAVSVLTRTVDETLLVGLRGLVRETLDSVGLDTVQQRPGGIYRSEDNGVTWTQSDDGLPRDAYVHALVDLGGGVILATATEAFRDPALDTPNTPHWNQSRSGVYRSTDNGRTWYSTFLETRKQPFSRCQHTMVNAGNDRLFAATVEKGVLESTDGGETWESTISGLDNRIILDLAIGPDGGIWAGTDKGLHYVMPTDPVSVQAQLHDPGDHLRYTSVWAYPTPTTGSLTVRVNNADLAGRGALSLKLYDLFGAELQDLTSIIAPLRSQRQVEFPLSLHHLPLGVYLLVIESPAGREACKVIKL